MLVLVCVILDTFSRLLFTKMQILFPRIYRKQKNAVKMTKDIWANKFSLSRATILPPWLLGEDISSQQSGSAFIRAELLIVCGQTTDKQWAVQHQAAPCRIIIATSSAEIAGLVLVVRIRNFRHDYQEIMTSHSHNHPHYHPDELSCTQEVSKHQQQVARTSTAAEIATNLCEDFTIIEKDVKLGCWLTERS